MTAYYNEHDPFAAAWLRELIRDNLIAPGEVDERSIEDVTPDDLRPFRQCHFFAGIGVWSLAARRAGWDDDTPLWTGSCPCQPFSAAGKGEGFTDERHLWPAFHYLIEQCRPPLVAGEQVAGKDGDAWFDLVSADLDATGYGFGVTETCAAGFGAPHKRNRNYWVAVKLDDPDRARFVGALQHAKGDPRDQARLRLSGAGRANEQLADSERARLEGFGGHGDDRHQPGRVGAEPARSTAARGAPVQLADSTRGGRREERPNAGGFAFGDSAEGEPAGSVDGGGAGKLADDDVRGRGARSGSDAAGPSAGNAANYGHCGAGGMADAEHDDRRADEPVGGSNRGAVDGGRGGAGSVDHAGRDRRSPRRHGDGGDDRLQPHAIHGDVLSRIERPGPVNGLWADADWLFCRDEKWRPVGPGSFPLADAGTIRNRVGLLRGAGNAVTLAQAEEFLIAVRRSL